MAVQKSKKKIKILNFKQKLLKIKQQINFKKNIIKNNKNNIFF